MRRLRIAKLFGDVVRISTGRRRCESASQVDTGAQLVAPETAMKAVTSNVVAGGATSFIAITPLRFRQLRRANRNSLRGNAMVRRSKRGGAAVCQVRASARPTVERKGQRVGGSRPRSPQHPRMPSRCNFPSAAGINGFPSGPHRVAEAGVVPRFPQRPNR
jgi:hypothetical protein